MPTPKIEIYAPKQSDDIEKRYKDLYNAYIELVNYIQWILGHLDSKNVKELDFNITKFKNLEAINIVTQTLITQTLYAEKGYIAELTVDQLDTSPKVKNYLNGNTDDVNYIKIYEQHIEFRTAKVKYEVDGITPLAPVQAVDRFDRPLYWADDTYKVVTYTANDKPVMIYQYDELMKMDITFVLNALTEEYDVKITLGAGVGNAEHPEYGKAFIQKVANGVIFSYIAPSGIERKIGLMDDGTDFGDNPKILGMPQLFVQTTEPTTAKTGDVWIDSDETTLETILTKLAGGTTGQVLRKKSNADYDFEWVTP